jgi:hypothetical protein
MKKDFYFLFCILSFCSCKDYYYPEINTDLNALSVDGLITDSVGLSYIILNTAQPYNLDDTVKYGSLHHEATVYLTDNSNITYYFDEDTAGHYLPRDKNFVGETGKTYVLNILTRDGNRYKSSPQKLVPITQPHSFYLKQDVKDDLFTNAYGDTKLIVRDIFKVCLDFQGIENVTPRSRFNTHEFIEYTIPLPGPPTIIYYCWLSINNDNGLIFTDEKYPAISEEIKGFPVEWYYKVLPMKVPNFTVNTYDYDTCLLDEYSFVRIIRINQYGINDDTYQFYKEIANQSADEGKIFDPITTQLSGNIKCINDTSKLVLGFFEVSSIKTYTYAISSFNLNKIVKVDNFLPPEDARGFIINSKPDFWIPIRSLD